MKLLYVSCDYIDIRNRVYTRYNPVVPCTSLGFVYMRNIVYESDEPSVFHTRIFDYLQWPTLLLLQFRCSKHCVPNDPKTPPAISVEQAPLQFSLFLSMLFILIFIRWIFFVRMQ